MIPVGEILMAKHRCENCSIRKYSEKNPGSWIAKLWKWHTKWCPGWKAYQKSLEEKAVEVEAQ